MATHIDIVNANIETLMSRLHSPEVTQAFDEGRSNVYMPIMRQIDFWRSLQSYYNNKHSFTEKQIACIREVA